MESGPDLIGRWPQGIQEARVEKRMLHLRASEMLHLIHGNENKTMVSFFTTNDKSHLGIMTIPINRFSDPEEHAGDEILMVLEGTLQIWTYDPGEDEASVSHRACEVKKGEKFLIPERVKHRYFNLSDQVLRLIFTVAPNY